MLASACKVYFALFFLIPGIIKAQTAKELHIFADAPVYAHPNPGTKSINIFSNVFQGGTFVSYNTVMINFFGRNWQNEANSRLPDESPNGITGIGGMFRFSGKLLAAQRIINIGSQPYNGFPNLRIDNFLNVTTETGDLHVNNNLEFANGNLILDNVDVTVGHDGIGTISGYGRTNFIVTGKGITGGSLKRSFTGSSTTGTVFPVGTSLTSYTPASLIYKGSPQNIKVRVANEVFNKLNFSEYVYKTWIIGRDFPDPSGTLDFTLQHNSVDEGIEYFRNRTEAYISRYNTRWVGLYDIVAPEAAATLTPGTITTRAAVFGASMNTRMNIGALETTEYFTKSVIKKQVDENTPVNIPDAISPNGDGLNDTYIVVKRLPTDKVRFEVFTRNQVLVYQNLDYDNSFDGTGNIGGFIGDLLPDGIYYYLISANGAKGIPGYLILNR